MKKKLILFLLAVLLLAVIGPVGCSEEKRLEGNQEKGEFEYSFVAKSDKGYYFWEPLTVEVGTSRLLFMDANSRKVVPLCNKPDCEHDTKECNAYYPAIGEAEYGFDKRYIQFYDGNLYALGHDDSGYVSLFRIDADGTEWEKVLQLYKTDFSVTSHWTTPYALLEGEYVYYVDQTQTEQKLQRKSFDGTEDITIFSGEKGKHSEVYRLKMYGDYLYFQSLYFTDETFESVEGGLYRYDKEGKCELIKEGLLLPYSVYGDTLYYGSNGQICCYSLNDKSETAFDIETSNDVDVSTTEEYIIVDDSDIRMTYFYDKKGKLRYSVDGDELKMHYFGGDSQFRFGRGLLNPKDEGWYVLDINDLNHSAEWKGL